MAADALVHLEHVGKSFGHFHALRDINLAIETGELVCLVGPSGCGKSTLLRIIAGLTAPSHGVVRYRGSRLHGVNPHTAIVFQTFALFPWLTVLENVEVALKARGVDKARRTRRAQELVDLVGLSGFESAYPRELSGACGRRWASPGPLPWSQSSFAWTNHSPRWMCSPRTPCAANF